MRAGFVLMGFVIVVLFSPKPPVCEQVNSGKGLLAIRLNKLAGFHAENRIGRDAVFKPIMPEAIGSIVLVVFFDGIGEIASTRRARRAELRVGEEWRCRYENVAFLAAMGIDAISINREADRLIAESTLGAEEMLALHANVIVALMRFIRVIIRLAIGKGFPECLGLVGLATALRTMRVAVFAFR